MADRQDYFPPSHRFMYKPLLELEEGGCHLDVYLPKGTGQGAVGVVMMIHGGGFVNGTGEWIPYNQVNYLLEHGLAVVSIEYRVLPHYALVEQAADVLDAYRFIQDSMGLNAQLKSGRSDMAIDPDRLSVIGWSAGASLAMYLPGHIASNNLTPLASLVLNYPMSDFGATPLAPGARDLFKSGHAKEVYEKLLAEKGTAHWTPFPPGPATESPPPPPSDMTVLPPRLAYFFYSVPSGMMQEHLLRSPRPFEPDQQPLAQIDETYPPTFCLMAGNFEVISAEQSQQVIDRLREVRALAQSVTLDTMTHAQAECLRFFPPWKPNDGDGWWKEGILPSLEFVVQRTA